MTTYSTITDGQIDQDSPITQPLITAIRDNPIAIAQRSAGAPFVENIWYPYDSNYSGENDGVFYDNSVDGDVSIVESPTFEADFDYLFYVDDLMVGPSNGNLIFQSYFETSAEYGGFYRVAGPQAGMANYCSIEFIRPFKVANIHIVPFVQTAQLASTGSTANSGILSEQLYNRTTAERLSKFRITATGNNNITSGKFYMYKRKALIG